MTALGACGGDREDEESSRDAETYAEGAGQWLDVVCDEEGDDRSEAKSFVPDGVDPINERSCTEWMTFSALEFEDDPRPALKEYEPAQEDVFYCRAKHLFDGNWVAVVVEDYELDDDVLEDLENYDFESCV